jgi:hypothetical protein
LARELSPAQTAGLQAPDDAALDLSPDDAALDLSPDDAAL